MRIIEILIKESTARRLDLIAKDYGVIFGRVIEIALDDMVEAFDRHSLERRIEETEDVSDRPD